MLLGSLIVIALVGCNQAFPNVFIMPLTVGRPYLDVLFKNMSIIEKLKI